MAKFRKKPVVIEAEQWNCQAMEGLVVWVAGAANPKHPQFTPLWAEIETLEGKLHVTLGDWIITGVQGEKYPCKPDIFAATYEPVED